MSVARRAMRGSRVLRASSTIGLRRQAVLLAVNRHLRDQILVEQLLRELLRRKLRGGLRCAGRIGHFASRLGAPSLLASGAHPLNQRCKEQRTKCR